MSYSQQVEAALKEFRVLKDDGSLRETQLMTPKNKPRGVGPILSPECIERLAAADTTPDKSWTRWIFFQAGGGEVGVSMRPQALDTLITTYVEQLMQGRAGAKHKMAEPEAKALAESMRPAFTEALQTANGDQIEKLFCFGYDRDWPGKNNVYSRTVEAITGFLAIQDRIRVMNEEIVLEGKTAKPSTPDTIKTIEQMADVTKETVRYFAAKKAREDLRLSGHPGRSDHYIYDDAIVTVVAPLTWAAAVRYGCDRWPWANAKSFDGSLMGTNHGESEWTKRTKAGNVFVHISFNKPVPAWVGRHDNVIKVFSLQNLALELTPEELSSKKTGKWMLWDEENQRRYSVDDVVKKIFEEPARVDQETEDTAGIPIKRGANVYKTPEEAQEVADHFKLAIKAVAEWAKTFDTSLIVNNPLSL